MRIGELIRELRRRRVFRAAGFYIVAAWVGVQVADLLFPALRIPEAAILYVWLIAASLLPLVIVFSWMYELTLDGITRTPPAQPGDNFDPSLRRLDYVLILALAVVAVSLTAQFGTRVSPVINQLDASINRFSIAVLPFDDLSGNPDEQYFVSGMQSSLIDGLSRVRNLQVTSKVSTLPYREAGATLLDIATELGVARIVEGTVLRNGNQVRIALRMHDVRENVQVWAATFEDRLENIMMLQARAAQEIANEVHVQLGPEEQEQFAAAKAVNPDAYLAVLRGVFHVERFNPEDMRIAATHFQRAVAIDPDYALGYWGLAKLCSFAAQAGVITPNEAQEQCLPPALKALELDPLLPEAHLGLAVIATWTLFRFDEAVGHFERAIELNPSLAEAHIFYAHLLGILGRLEQSSMHADRAVRLDPANPFMHGLYSIQLNMRNELEEAIRTAEHALSMAPGYAFGYVTLMFAHDTLGNEAEAVAAQANMLRNVTGAPEAADFFESAFEDLGYEAANVKLAEALIEQSRNAHVPAFFIAVAFEQGGDYERALDWFETAVATFDPDAPYLGVMMKDPGIRTNPRYKALLRKLELNIWADQL